MDEPLDARIRGGDSQCSGRKDAAGLKVSPPAPVADLGGAMEDPPGSSDGSSTRGGIRQIASYDLQVETFEELGVAPRAHQRPDALTPRSQPFGHMTAQ